ncbi:Hypp1589 [Branchiostoma lanceolatum]|uniref:Hypp1589 protein n=1 Tax=Branchiostoma lanceolatum TaxID=7740 RepID=A0A8K0EJI2_BRALA|nr:Hypp1589 [Branchiostoma lanceolatum]
MLHKRQQVLSESESNWDSSDEEKSSVIETPRTTDAPKDMLNSKTAGEPAKSSQPKPSPRPDKQATLGKNSASQTGMKSGISVFSDRSRRHDNDGERRVKPGRDQPPYDFKGVVTPDKPSPGRQPPGKGRKGHSYDPDTDLQPNSSKNAVLGSWDDSDAEEETMAAIRANIAKDTAKSAPADTKSSAGSNKNNDSSQRKDKKGKKEDAGMWPGGSSGRRKEQENLSISTRQLGPEAGDSGSETAEPYGPGTERSPQYSPGNESNSRSVYPFHQGAVNYLYATEGSAHAVMPAIADKSEVMVRRGVQELFGVMRLLVDVFVILAVELARFVFRQVVQNLLIGLLVVMGDHFVKPLVAALFNSFLQPVLMLLWNVATATRTVFGPVVDILRGVALQFAVVLRAFRLVELNWRADSREHPPLEDV